MRKGLLALGAGAAMMIGAVSAEAMPATPLVDAGSAPEVLLVSGGCGIAFHRGPFGGCRPNGFFRPYGYRYGYGRPYGYRRFGYRY